MGTTREQVQKTAADRPTTSTTVAQTDSFAAPVMALQRTIGNRAVQGLFQQLRVQRTTTLTDASAQPQPSKEQPSKESGPAQKTSEASPAKGQAPQAEPSSAASSVIAPTFDQVKSLDAIDRLSEAQIVAIKSDAVDGNLPYRVIHDVFSQSWHVVKEELLKPGRTPQITNTRRALMKKLIEYRQWHHQEILKEVSADLAQQTKTPEALKKSGGAGSTALSSDIDVNLKGTRTEMAVAAFNTAFKSSNTLKNQVWDYEPGVVYDVNVYAIDFMHKYGAVDQDGKKVTMKEGARGPGDAGGIRDPMVAAADRLDQLATAMFKNRLYMSQAEFDDYHKQTVRGLGTAEKATMDDAFAMAEEHFVGYLNEMVAQMGENVKVRVDKAASGVKQLQQRAAAMAPAKWGSDAHVVAAKREDAVMGAANRIYERKLQEIATKRASLAGLLDQLKQPQADRAKIERSIDVTLADIRSAVADAAKYANEPSMTDATIHHGVVGIQGGLEIDQQKHEGLDALNEHLADIHKEAGRYKEFGEASYKSGKYMMRLGDAARNMGFGYVFGVQQLYEAGYKISVDIKGKADSDPQLDTARASAAVIKEVLGAKTVSSALALARQVAASVSQEYMQERAAETGPGGSGDTATAFGHRTGKLANGKPVANENVLNKNMVHPADRQGGKAADASEMETAQAAGDLEDDFRFRLTPEELAKLQKEWAARKK